MLKKTGWSKHYFNAFWIPEIKKKKSGVGDLQQLARDASTFKIFQMTDKTNQNLHLSWTFRKHLCWSHPKMMCCSASVLLMQTMTPYIGDITVQLRHPYFCSQMTPAVLQPIHSYWAPEYLPCLSASSIVSLKCNTIMSFWRKGVSVMEERFGSAGNPGKAGCKGDPIRRSPDPTVYHSPLWENNKQL